MTFWLVFDFAVVTAAEVIFVIATVVAAGLVADDSEAGFDVISTARLAVVLTTRLVVTLATALAAALVVASELV